MKIMLVTLDAFWHINIACPKFPLIYKIKIILIIGKCHCTGILIPETKC